MSERFSIRLLSFAACALLIPVFASAQTVSAAPRLPPPFSVEVSASHTFDGDLKGTDAQVNRSAVLGDVSYNLPPIEQRLFVKLSVSGGELWYDFSGPTTLAPGSAKPWKEISLGSLSASALYVIDRHWSAFGAANVSYAGESGADFGDSITGGGVVGANYKVSDDLTIGALVLVQSRLEDNVLVIPFPTFTWKLPFDDARRFSLSLGGSEAGSILGAGATLAFAASEKLSFGLSVTGFGLGGDFRLSGSGAIPDGVGRDFTVPLVLSARWQPASHLTFSAFAGASLFGNVEALDSSGDKIIDRDIDPALMIGANVSIAF